MGEFGIESTMGERGMDLLFAGFRAGQADLHGREEVVAHHWFGEVIVSPEIHPDPDIVTVAFGRQENERGGRQIGILPQGLDHAIAIHLGHHDIAEHEVRAVLAGLFETDPAVFRRENFIPFQFKHERDVPAHGGLVFDNEETFFHVGWIMAPFRIPAIRLKSDG